MKDHFEGNVDMLMLKTSFDPLRQFLIFARPHKPSICQNHKSIISFPSHNSSKALCCLSHGIKLKELISISNLLVVYHKLNPLQQDGIMRILDRKANHNNSPSVMILKINSFCNFTPSNGKINSSSSNIASLSILP